MLVAVKAPRAGSLRFAMVAGLTLVVATLASVPLWRMTAPNMPSDTIPHAYLAVGYVEGGNLFTYSLWYPLIWLTSGGGNADNFRIASVALLTFFVVLRALVAYFIAQSYLDHPWSSAGIALAATFFGPMVNPMTPHDIYLGQIPATVWHNSTNIMVAPFALIAFWAAVRLLRTLTLRAALIAGVACMLAVLIKPNFMIAAIPVFAIALLAQFVRSRVSLKQSAFMIVAAGFPPLIMLAMQYLTIYGGGLQREESLTIAPFGVWKQFSDNIALSILLSLIGVIAVFIVVFVRDLLSFELVLAWIILAVAVAQATLFAEQLADGSIAQSGNWFWGTYTALGVVVLWTALGARSAIVLGDSTRHRLLPIVATGALVLHVLAGIYYAMVIGTSSYGAF